MKVTMTDSARPTRRPEPTYEIDRCAHEVIGAALEVHRQLGPGFLETTYEEALAIELGLRSLPFRRQVPVGLQYKGHSIGEARVDLLVRDSLIVELKAVAMLLPIHLAQALSYLKAMKQPLALVINFNVPVRTRGVRRVVLAEPRPSRGRGSEPPRGRRRQRRRTPSRSSTAVAARPWAYHPGVSARLGGFSETIAWSRI